MIDLTIAIPVLNEEKNLPGCLKAIGKNFVKSIVIIDSQSTDRSKQFAMQHGATVIDFKWNGKFPKKRNWFLQNYPISTKWILFLDADEYLTESFKQELVKAISSTDNIGYWLNYTIFFMGKKLVGGYPLKKLALFRVGAGEYERIDDQRWSSLDMEVHEHPILKGRIGSITSKIDHQDFRGIGSYVAKHEEYATWEAERIMQQERHVDSSNWTWKQNLKYRLIHSVWLGPAFFFGSFICLGGFRDGTRGLAFAILKMSYFNLVYCKICEKRNNIGRTAKEK